MPTDKQRAKVASVLSATTTKATTDKMLRRKRIVDARLKNIMKQGKQ